MGQHSKKTEKHSANRIKVKNKAVTPKRIPEKEHEDNILYQGVTVSVAMIILLVAVIVPSSGLVRLLSFLIPFFLCGYKVILEAVEKIISGDFLDEDFLMTVSSVCAFLLGEYPEGAAIMVFYQLGELMEQIAENRSRSKIKELSELRPDYANIETENGLIKISPSEISVGSEIVVLPGERIPLDGVISDGETTVNNSILTGESLPVFCKPGDKVLSGCINVASPIHIVVNSDISESTSSRILAMIEDSVERKSSQESFIHRFSKIYTPAVVSIAVFIALIPSLISGNWSLWINKALVFLVVSCPCALVVSVPLAYFAGIGNASKNGIIVKGSNYLEALARTETMVFDKTGTITEGVFEVSDVYPKGISKDVLLNFAGKAEEYSSHPIGIALRNAADRVFLSDSKISDYKEVPGKGISAFVNGAAVCVGNFAFIENYCQDIEFPDCGGTVAFVAINGKFRGSIAVSDRIKDGAFDALEKLRSGNVKKLVMLTGDVQNVSRRVASSLNFDLVKSELLPEDKVASVEYLIKNENKGACLAFVGDGVNDAPVLARSDVGIAMGAFGSDAAIESADVVIMDDDLGKLSIAMNIARDTVNISRQNIYVSFAAKAVIMLLGLVGIGGIWIAVFGDVGVLIAAVLNSLRMMNKKF